MAIVNRQNPAAENPMAWHMSKELNEAIQFDANNVADDAMVRQPTKATLLAWARTRLRLKYASVSIAVGIAALGIPIEAPDVVSPTRAAAADADKDAESVFASDIVDLITRLQDANAKEAIAACEKSIRKAKEDEDDHKQEARKKLLPALEEAQMIAGKANHLDEAILIRDIRKAIENGNDPRAGIEVITALYGQNISWLDVTDKVRKAIGNKDKWSTFVKTKDWGEPAPGFTGPRTMIIRCRVNGKISLQLNYEDKEIKIASDELDLIKKLKDPNAKRAILAFDTANFDATKALDKESQDARKKLLAVLEDAQARTFKADQLDEAALIRNLRKAMENENALKAKIEIITAVYGANVSWLDVTDKVRKVIGKSAKWSAVVRTEDWGEPAPGFDGRRALIIQYRANGRIMLARSYEGDQIKVSEK
jgi:hypothetical protein